MQMKRDKYPDALLSEHRRKLLIDAAKLPGFDLMLARPDGHVAIAERKARFCFIGKTAEAMYHHSEGREHVGFGCRKVFPDQLSEQYYCWMNISLKKDEGFIDVPDPDYCRPEIQ
jgi:hypothetical protein